MPACMPDSRAPTHLAGQHGRSTQYERAILAERRASASRATFTPVQITALCVLPLAVIPWAANKIVVSIIGEPLVSFHIAVSAMLSIATAAFALWQIHQVGAGSETSKVAAGRLCGLRCGIQRHLVGRHVAVMVAGHCRASGTRV
jgi:hypothetical protein